MLIRYGKTAQGAPIKQAIIYTKAEHSLKQKDIDPDAVSILLRLRSAGHTAYIVGGAIRDLLVGRKPKDFDLVTDAHPRKIKRLFRNSRIIGKRFRLVHVYFGNKIIEVSTFRSFNSVDQNEYGTIQEDVLRRDFTLNALYYCPLEEIILDYVGGVKDIQDRIVRPLIPLKQIFSEDPVRMLRAVKYAAMLDFKIPFFTRRAILKESSLLHTSSPSRLTEELFKILGTGAAASTLKALYSFKLLRYFIPALDIALRENKNNFADRFYRTMESFDHRKPNGEERVLGLQALLRVSLEDLKLKEEQGETEVVPLLFKDYYTAAKKFLFPLSPPNRDVDRAVLSIFRELKPKRARK
ncbi:MAG: polynucleotide adenylyltransferase PcnB, partial [Spirochaetales bacterium]